MKKNIKKIHWSVQTECNMACKFCYLWRSGNQSTLSTSAAKQLIKEASDINIEWLVFGGGDPLLRNDLPYLIKYAKSLGLKTDLQTNGLLLTSDIFRQIQGNIDRIGLSLDGEDAKIHDEIRNYPGHFNKVLAVLSMCSHYQIPVTIRTLICKPNIGKIEDLGKTLREYPSISKWSLREFVPLERGIINIDKYFVTRECFLKEANKIYETNSCEASLFSISILTADSMKNCYCLVSPDGYVYNHPCGKEYSSFGKFPQESLRDIFSRLNYDSDLRYKRDVDGYYPIAGVANDRF